MSVGRKTTSISFFLIGYGVCVLVEVTSYTATSTWTGSAIPVLPSSPNVSLGTATRSSILAGTSYANALP